MGQTTLSAQIRTSKGKGAARALRRDNKIPAIFYGPKTEPIMLAVDYPELKRILQTGASENLLIDLEVKSDQGSETRKVMLKDVLMDSIRDTCLHADFYEISMDKEIHVEIPIKLVNTPKGVSEGGVLETIRRELRIACMPSDLISHVDIDVSEMEIGDSLHIRDIQLPAGISSIDEEHLTIAVLAAPTTKGTEEKEEAEAAEESEEGAEAKTESAEE